GVADERDSMPFATLDIPQELAERFEFAPAPDEGAEGASAETETGLLESNESEVARPGIVGSREPLDLETTFEERRGGFTDRDPRRAESLHEAIENRGHLALVVGVDDERGGRAKQAHAPGVEPDAEPERGRRHALAARGDFREGQRRVGRGRRRVVDGVEAEHGTEATRVRIFHASAKVFDRLHQLVHERNRLTHRGRVVRIADADAQERNESTVPVRRRVDDARGYSDSARRRSRVRWSAGRQDSGG